MEDFGSVCKTVEGNEGNKCHYSTRLDTYGRGCSHDCSYCYAKSLLSFRGLWNPKHPAVSPISEISKQIRKLPKNEVVRLGGMTDCFQPIEKLYQNTYKTIKLLNRRKIPYLIVTKSAIIAEDVLAVNMYYGQRHDREIRSAHDIASYYGVELMELDLSAIFAKSDCSLLKRSDKAIPEGSYAEQQKESNNTPVSTYVPFRNGLMLSAAASIAVSVGAEYIYYGAHADDVAGNAYPDCSAEFTEAINKAIYEGSGEQVNIIAPFISCNKSEIVRTGIELKVPYGLTWSCYNGEDKPCGKCGTCIDREKAFKDNGIGDPLYD